MKQIRLYLPLILATLLALSYQQTSYADLTASQVVSQFNSLNGGVGFRFNALTTPTGQYRGTYSGESRLQAISGTDIPDLSAYTSQTSDSSLGYFQSFCVEPEEQITPGYTVNNAGTLNFANGKTITSYTGQALNLGVAYLYKEFANGTLTGYNYTYGAGRANSAVLLQDAIYFLLGKTADMINASTNWTTNVFLQNLLLKDSVQANWLAVYNPDGTYAIMGDNKVFVMSVVEEKQNPLSREMVQTRQDQLYVTKTGSSTVPEPATIAIWMLGSLGFIGSACRQRFARKKNA
ncbi:MAG: hypothetical protein FWC50_04345 [Planctomycetaceae bacterium]|nr:hypothetical protein [Planctomycetaceae bacterium]